MQLEEFLLHYSLFNQEFFPEATLEEIEDKMVKEMEEMNLAISYDLTIEEKISEALDVMNVSIKLLTAYGVKNVLDAGYMKLQQTARKYRNTPPE